MKRRNGRTVPRAFFFMSIRCNTLVLRGCRRRSGLTQNELAELFGSRRSSLISRLENGVRRPDITVLIAYEVVFGSPPRDLLNDSYREAERRVAMRARALKTRIETHEPSARHKVEFLDSLIRQSAP